MEKLSFRIPVFEGPLDALLYLISKNKLNIYDVPISELLDQYMDYLNSMQEMDLDITSDFLEMASRLVEIKSSMLLPKPDASKKEELIATLIGYKTCKAMAEALRQHDLLADIFVRDAIRIEHDETYRCTHSIETLLDAYLKLGSRIKSRRPPVADEFGVIVAKKIVSVTSRIVHVIKRLLRNGKQSFYSMFDDAKERSEAVATFLAMLELIKSKKIVVDDDENLTVRVNR